MYRLTCLSFIFAIFACGVAPTASPDHGHGHALRKDAQEAGGRVSVHGMVAFGDAERQFFSHIPMYHAPHDIQVVFEVRFDAQAFAGFGEKLYTFQPEPFSLDDAISGTLTTIDGVLFAGNFEDGGAPLATLEVELLGIVFGAQVLSTEQVRATALSYAIIGERFLVHPITHPNDFDQILRLQDPISGKETLTLADRSNSFAMRARVGESLTQEDESVAKISHELSLLRGPHFVP